ncbi:Uncharacterised protein [Vibrio cholerae]|nr:Uncharacterised protein [Vibrio cholerae]
MTEQHVLQIPRRLELHTSVFWELHSCIKPSTILRSQRPLDEP